MVVNAKAIIIMCVDEEDEGYLVFFVRIGKWLVIRKKTLILKEFAAYTREFRRHWLEYLMLFLSLDLLNQFVIIPLFRYITTFVLQAGAIPFVSYQNIITIITTHTVVFIILIIELLLLLVMIYAQFAYLLHGVRAIYSKNFTLKNSFKQIWQNIKKIRLGSLLLLALYFLEWDCSLHCHWWYSVKKRLERQWRRAGNWPRKCSGGRLFGVCFC